jgi:hypothetical protein
LHSGTPKTDGRAVAVGQEESNNFVWIGCHPLGDRSQVGDKSSSILFGASSMAHLQSTILEMCLSLQESDASIELSSQRIVLVICGQNANKSRIVCPNLRDIGPLSRAESCIAIAIYCSRRSGEKERERNFEKHLGWKLQQKWLKNCRYNKGDWTLLYHRPRNVLLVHRDFPKKAIGPAQSRIGNSPTSVSYPAYNDRRPEGDPPSPMVLPML